MEQHGQGICLHLALTVRNMENGVEHMIDKPHEAYQQNTSFLSAEELDEESLRTFFYRHCDSSQLVAVEPRLSGFEGPPGTGKSETIANMIVEQPCQRRKVLFVAEKQT